jgi:hypothetical protein
LEQCEYWATEAQTQYCELMSGACKCEGNEANCAIRGNSISSFLKRQEREINREVYIKDMRKRSHSYLN